jgi:hypothetical protein
MDDDRVSEALLTSVKCAVVNLRGFTMSVSYRIPYVLQAIETRRDGKPESELLLSFDVAFPD